MLTFGNLRPQPRSGSCIVLVAFITLVRKDPYSLNMNFRVIRSTPCMQESPSSFCSTLALLFNYTVYEMLLLSSYRRFLFRSLKSGDQLDKHYGSEETEHNGTLTCSKIALKSYSTFSSYSSINTTAGPASVTAVRSSSVVRSLLLVNAVNTAPCKPVGIDAIPPPCVDMFRRLYNGAPI